MKRLITANSRSAPKLYIVKLKGSDLYLTADNTETTSKSEACGLSYDEAENWVNELNRDAALNESNTRYEITYK